jgi:catalase (peroxidase I)
VRGSRSSRQKSWHVNEPEQLQQVLAKLASCAADMSLADAIVLAG